MKEMTKEQKQIVDLVAKEVFRRTAIMPPLDRDSVKDEGNGMRGRYTQVAISPASAGPIGMMFKEINLDVRFGFFSEKAGDFVRIEYQFSYEHPRGSNGYEVSELWTLEKRFGSPALGRRVEG